MTQPEWEEAVVDLMLDWGFRPDVAECVRLRMVQGSITGRDGHPLPPDELDFLQDRFEEAMDGLAYVVGDMYEREVRLSEDPEVRAWMSLLNHIANKLLVRKRERLTRK